MSHSLPPEPPLPCHLPSIIAQTISDVEQTAQTLGFPPPEPTKHPQNPTPLGLARKRAIAVLLVLANLVPVCSPLLSLLFVADVCSR